MKKCEWEERAISNFSTTHEFHTRKPPLFTITSGNVSEASPNIDTLAIDIRGISDYPLLQCKPPPSKLLYYNGERTSFLLFSSTHLRVRKGLRPLGIN